MLLKERPVGHGQQDGVGQFLRLGQGEVAAEDDKFLAAVTDEGVPGIQKLADGAGKIHQHHVSRRVAELVVHPLEEIYVQHQDGEGRAVLPTDLSGLDEGFLQGVAVEAFRQVVDLRLVGQLPVFVAEELLHGKIFLQDPDDVVQDENYGQGEPVKEKGEDVILDGEPVQESQEGRGDHQRQDGPAAGVAVPGGPDDEVADVKLGGPHEQVAEGDPGFETPEAEGFPDHGQRRQADVGIDQPGKGLPVPVGHELSGHQVAQGTEQVDGQQLDRPPENRGVKEQLTDVGGGQQPDAVHHHEDDGVDVGDVSVAQVIDAHQHDDEQRKGQGQQAEQVAPDDGKDLLDGVADIGG